MCAQNRAPEPALSQHSSRELLVCLPPLLEYKPQRAGRSPVLFSMGSPPSLVSLHWPERTGILDLDRARTSAHRGKKALVKKKWAREGMSRQEDPESQLPVSQRGGPTLSTGS